jgi:hypothetical protein
MKPDLNFQVIDHGDGLVAFVKIVPVRVPVDSAASLLMKKPEIWALALTWLIGGERATTPFRRRPNTAGRGRL